MLDLSQLSIILLLGVAVVLIELRQNSLIVNGALRKNNAVDTSLIRFFIYPNPDDRKFFQEIKFGDEASLKAAKLDPESQIFILIHGFTVNFTNYKSSTQILKNAYLQRGFSNILAVDWFRLAESSDALPKSYAFAVSNVQGVGKHVAKFIKFIIDKSRGGKITSSQFHLIGHSLGSHVSGVAGFTYHRKLTKGQEQIGRITGLDPAFPLFYEKYDKLNRRLDGSDAKFVDVLHTNMGMLGTPYPSGSVDFYANGGGPYQPGCLTPIPGPNEPDPLPDEVVRGSCSHRRAFYFFAQTISNENKYYGCQCEFMVINNTATTATATEGGMSNNPATDKIQYECNKIMSVFNQCQRKTMFGQYVSQSARGLYDLKIDVKDPSKYYE